MNISEMTGQPEPDINGRVAWVLDVVGILLAAATIVWAVRAQRRNRGRVALISASGPACAVGWPWDSWRWSTVSRD